MAAFLLERADGVAPRRPHDARHRALLRAAPIATFTMGRSSCWAPAASPPAGDVE